MATNQRRTSSLRPMRLPFRIPVFTVVVCVCLLVTLARVSIGGFYCQDRFGDGYIEVDFEQGWPILFAKHGMRLRTVPSSAYAGDYDIVPPPFLGRFNPCQWTSFHVTNVTGAAIDVALQVLLLAATAAVAWRFESRFWGHFQFSIRGMLSLTAAVGTVLGLVSLDRSPLVQKWDGWYLPLREMRLFDHDMLLLATGCAVGLVVSTILGRLSRQNRQEPSV
jgi:hypothetical protein